MGEIIQKAAPAICQNKCTLGKKGCTAQDPFDVNGRRLRYYSVPCRHFTCSEGIKAARKALGRSGRRTITFKGQKLNAKVFGTPDKPPWSKARRFVVDQPNSPFHLHVLTTTTKGQLHLSPVKIEME